MCEVRTGMKKTKKGTARNILGPRLRELRLAAQPPISQEDLAGRLAARGLLIDRSAISRVENQERYLMDYEFLGIAACLRVSPEDVVKKK